MTKVLILGATGQIARWAIEELSEKPDVQMTLLMRDEAKLAQPVPSNAQVVVGDVMDRDLVERLVSGQDIVYANLFGEMDEQAEVYVAAMEKAGVDKLIHVSSLGIYKEIPGKFGEWTEKEIGAYLPPYRAAADRIEASKLDYIIIRPAFLSDYDEVDYELTERDEPFRGTEVSRKSIGVLVADLVRSGLPLGRRNVGVNKPNTDADMPRFMQE